MLEKELQKVESWKNNFILNMGFKDQKHCDVYFDKIMKIVLLDITKNIKKLWGDKFIEVPFDE
jgi:hypothetical protein